MPQHETECLFCRGTERFSTVEHIVPESLGNTDELFIAAVCDTCQNYLAREVEKVALEKTPIAFWRSLLGTTTKRGNLPSVDLTPPEKGRIPATHPLTDTFAITSHSDGSTSLDIGTPSLAREINTPGRSQLRLVLTPFHLCALGRFLGKLGLEFLAKQDNETALNARYDPVRAFVRYGTTSRLWAVYWGTQGTIQNLRNVSTSEDEYIVEHECYRYALGETQRGGHLFAFGIGTDLWLISLADRLPERAFEGCVEGVPLTCVFYPDGSW